MSTEFKKLDFNSPVEVIDPKSAQFQEDLASRAGQLAGEMLDSAFKEDVRVQASVLNAYTKYRTAINEDVSNIFDKLLLMGDKKLRLLEKVLKQRGAMEDFKSGKFDLSDVYGLPKKKK